MERKIPKRTKFVLYAMIACQLVAWAWFSSQGGQIQDKQFLVFTAMMLLGQLGAGIETFILRAWGAFAVQVWFFGFTAYGGIVRFVNM